MAVTPQTISGQIDKIEPVRWHSGTGSGVFGMHESERLKEIAKKFGRERPSHVEELVPELKSISADEPNSLAPHMRHLDI